MTIQAQDAPDLPDLPEIEPTTEAPKTSAPMDTRNLPETSPVQPRMPRITQEQMDRANKEKNWLTEGLKEKEMQAEALREAEAHTQKSIIDEILERNQQQVSGVNTPHTSPLSDSQPSGSMKAAISTTAWEPLEPMQGSSYDQAMGTDAVTSNSSKNYKKIDEKTGISNVFFNPVTGGFETQPVEFNSNNPMNRPELQKSWMQPANQMADAAERKQVEAFEARMLQQARAENRLPQNYSNPNLNLSDSSSPLLAGNTAPANPNTVNSNLAGDPFSAQTDAQSNNSYAASAAKLRMMEEERQRKLKQDTRPKTIDIHSPNQGRKFEINPRF